MPVRHHLTCEQLEDIKVSVAEVKATLVKDVRRDAALTKQLVAQLDQLLKELLGQRIATPSQSAGIRDES